jgi:YbgC/YbaW family acyl-CoA thioester hydrolase
MSTTPDERFDSVTHVFPCQVQWGDCDPAGIIFYPTYFRWIDAASWALFDAVGYSAKWMKAHHTAMPLVSAQCQFLFPAEQGDRCEVRSRIARFGGKSFVVEHDVVRSDGTPLAKGQETRVWGRFAGGPGTPLKGEAIPEALKARFRAK